MTRLSEQTKRLADLRSIHLQDVADAYRSGVSVKALAASYGVSYGAMRATLDLADVPVRGRGRSLTPAEAAEEAALAATFTRLYVADRRTLREVSAATGAPYGRVRRMLLANGVTLRGRGSRRGFA